MADNPIFAGSTESYITAEELGKILHLSAETINIWVGRYENFPHLVLPNKSVRFRPSEVAAWLKSKKEII